MHKAIAILNVIAWSGFWAFGYLALTAGPAAGNQTLIAGLLAAAGGGAGIWAYLKLCCRAEDTGYARPARRAIKTHLEEEIA